MFNIPGNNKRWTQTNNSDRFGTLSYTRGMTFDTEGYARLSKRSRSLFDETVDAQLDEVIAFEYEDTNDRYYILTADQIFYADNELQTFTQDTATNVPTTLNSRSDMLTFNAKIHVSAGTTDDLRSWDGADWSTALYSLTDNVAPMCVFENKNALAIAQSNTVLLLDTSYSLLETLTLPSQFRVTSMAYSNARLYITTRNTVDGEGLMFEWDGNSAQANNAYPFGSIRADCVKPYLDTVIIYTGVGQLLVFNGAGFSVLANHPLYYTDYLYCPQGTTLQGPTSHRGMIVDGDIIYLNVRSLIQASLNNTVGTNFNAKYPSGIWCYDPLVGFYHRHSISADLRLQTNAITTANVNTSTEVITVAGVTVPESGTPVFYDNGGSTSIAGLTHREKYFTIYQSDTTLKLATTRANAIAGTAIDLTGTGNNAQYLVFAPNRDFGGDKTTSSTALQRIQIPDPHRTDAFGLLFSGALGKSTVTAVDTVNALAENQESRGCMITARLDASQRTELFSRILIKFDGIKDPEDVIVVKATTVERDDNHQEIDVANTQTATFSDGNTFTTTADLSDVVAGDEVTFHSGTGMGYTAHISSLSEAGGTYTVNLDETVVNLAGSDTALFTVEHWDKIGTITTDDVDTYSNAQGNNFSAQSGQKSFPYESAAKYIKIKIETRGTDVMVEDILVNNKSFSLLL